MISVGVRSRGSRRFSAVSSRRTPSSASTACQSRTICRSTSPGTRSFPSKKPGRSSSSTTKAGCVRLEPYAPRCMRKVDTPASVARFVRGWAPRSASGPGRTRSAQGRRRELSGVQDPCDPGLINVACRLQGPAASPGAPRSLSTLASCLESVARGTDGRAQSITSWA